MAAVRWALAPAPGGGCSIWARVPAKLTSALLAAGADVAAVEPDPAMLAELRRALQRVRAVPGSAEEIPLPDGSVDAVLAGNAMHWFDMAVAGPEIARVLAPGGILAGLWNVMDDAVAWVAGLAEVGGDAGDEGGDPRHARTGAGGGALPDPGVPVDPQRVRRGRVHTAPADLRPARPSAVEARPQLVRMPGVRNHTRVVSRSRTGVSD